MIKRAVLLVPLLLLLGALFGPPAQGQNAPLGLPAAICNTGFAGTQAGPLAITRIVTGQAGQSIYLCGWNINNTGGAPVTITLSSGTGTNCGTGTVTGPVVTVTNGQTNIDHESYASIALAPGTDLCWTLTGTGTFNGTIYYGIFRAP